MIQIAILGFGVVGSGTAEVLTENKELIAKRCKDEINVKYILDLRDFPDSPFADRVVHDFGIIVNDPEIAIVAEMMGGSHPAYDFSKAALLAGKSVLVEKPFARTRYECDDLIRLAKENGVLLAVFQQTFLLDF